jgi:hypothetical protein
MERKKDYLEENSASGMTKVVQCLPRKEQVLPDTYINE